MTIAKPLVERVKAHAIEVGECWEWKGATQSTSTTPVIRYEGKAVSVMRALAIDAGMRVEGRIATNSCRNPKCVNPEHVILVSRKMLNNKVAEEQQYQKRPTYRLAVSKGSTRRKISEADVITIRASSESTAVLAETYGVTRSHINSILNGHRRRMMSNNVFAGLMR